MKLAFITQDFPPETGGIQTYSLEIASRIHAYCDDFVLIAPYKSNAHEVDSQLPFEVCRVKSPNTLLGLLSIPKVIRLLKKRKINHIFHAQWQTLPVSFIAKKMGLLDVVYTAANVREYRFNPFGGTTLGRNFYNKHKAKMLTVPDFFFPVSSFVSTLLGENGIPSHQREVVINGTNPKLFFPMDQKILREKHQLGEKKIVISISRLIELKGVDTVLEAIPEIIKEIPDFHYLIVGKGDYESVLREMVQQLNIEKYVSFIGRIPYEEIKEYYNLADIFVMPSKVMPSGIESFGIVFLEANACGKAVIGSRTGGIPDAVLEEETGLLVDERNPSELAKAIIRLLKDKELRDRLGMQGMQRVKTEANWDAVSKKIFGLIKERAKPND